jgi:hypothetical protein
MGTGINRIYLSQHTVFYKNALYIYSLHIKVYIPINYFIFITYVIL